MKNQTGNQIALSEAKVRLGAIRESLKIQKNVIVGIRNAIKREKESARSAKINAKQVKAAASAERKAAQVAKLEARLAAMKAPKGAAAVRRATRKPSKVVITKGPKA
jgi:hypothetical protein